MKHILKTKFLFLFLFIFMPQVLWGKNYCKLSDKLVKSYIKESAIPRKLLLSAHGGAMMHDIKKIILNFKSFEALDLDEGRILYVDMMEEFLIKINNDNKIRPFLHTFPFKTDNYELTLGFRDSQFNIRSEGHLALIFIGRDNEIIFCGYSTETKAFYDIHREPYEEALKIVNAQREDNVKKCAA